MKNYKDFEKMYIGDSDIASLILAGFKENIGLSLKELHFSEDASYNAYVVDEECNIPEHYEFVESFDCWLKIYDDTELVCRFSAEKINVYRAGNFGCIIQLINKETD